MELAEGQVAETLGLDPISTKQREIAELASIDSTGCSTSGCGAVCPQRIPDLRNRMR